MRSETLPLRVRPDLRARIDAYVAAYEKRKKVQMSRAEAMRHLIEVGLREETRAR